MTDVDAGKAQELEALLAFLRDARGFDFTTYKRSSITRRIDKRMVEVGAPDYQAYRDRLEATGDEFSALFNTILINVTGFFRDPPAWQHLQTEVIPDVVSLAGPTDEIRVWSAGSSSGEEAYSLAIAFAEVMGLASFLDRVKIYGTDVDEDALRFARAALYPEKALDGVAEELRGKYFQQREASFVVRPDLRRRVIFGRHDLTRDAPISRLHLLACRNTLMYFNAETQSQIVERFRFALRDNGYLFLGRAEMLLSGGDQFEVANLRQRIYRRRVGRDVINHQPAIRFETKGPAPIMDDTRRRQVRDVVIDAVPDGVVAVDMNGNVVLINSQARATFGLTLDDVGRPFRDLDLSYRPTELRSLIERAQLERRTLRINAVDVRRNIDDIEHYDVLIQPLVAADAELLGTSLVFIDTTVATRLQQEIKRSREELETAYEELQSTNEELETTNEEIQSSNEELETTNEELQSTNEELESTNEELRTMNDEMRSRTTDADETSTYLEAVLDSVAPCVIVLDKNLTVRTWTDGAQDMWGLRADEAVGHRFLDLEFGLPTAQLADAVRRCLETGKRGQPAIEVHAVNRVGAGIDCAVACAPLDSDAYRGVVLLVDRQPTNNARPSRPRSG